MEVHSWLPQPHLCKNLQYSTTFPLGYAPMSWMAQQTESQISSLDHEIFTHLKSQGNQPCEMQGVTLFTSHTVFSVLFHWTLMSLLWSFLFIKKSQGIKKEKERGPKLYGKCFTIKEVRGQNSNKFLNTFWAKVYYCPCSPLCPHSLPWVGIPNSAEDM
jgi:hypothetical protein